MNTIQRDHTPVDSGMMHAGNERNTNTFSLSTRL